MTFFARNAFTGEPLSPAYQDATDAEIGLAGDHAGRVAEKLALASADDRAALLEAIADEIAALGDRLIQRAHLETGLPIARLESERGRTMAQLRLFAALVREGLWVDARIDTAQPGRKPLPRPDVRRMLRPLGPVAVFGASNFPLAFSVAGGDTASALAAGNPAVVKAHPAHPGTSDLVAEAIRSAVARIAFPPEVFGLLHGASPEVSLALVRHPAIAAVGFTGSLRAGRALFDTAAARPRPIPVFAEMSSVNPVFVLPAALRERGETIAEGLVASSALGVGQFCTKPGVVFGVDSPAWQAFGATVARHAEGVAPGVMLHPGIAEAFARGVENLSGIEWLARGPAKVARVTAAEFSGRPELAHELFGPFVLLVTAPDEETLRALARSFEGQLTATLHGTPDDLTAAADLAAILSTKAGRLLCNGFPTGVEVVPAMQHGGPYPATTDARFTSVGTAAIFRFARPVCYQNFPEALLPAELRNANPLGILRLVDGRPTRDPIAPA